MQSANVSVASIAAASRTVVVLQPGYLPWLGFFDQVRRSDVFVYYDDVQYDKHGWRNRNRLKSPAGDAVWVTVPVRHAGLGWPSICEVEIEPGSHWARKHTGTIRQFYAHAPHFRRYFPELEELLHRPWRLLVDLDLAVTALMCTWLGLERSMMRSSALGISGDKSERLVRICEKFSANRYLSGDAAHDYLDIDLFARRCIDVVWQDFRHPTYPQLSGAFVPYLSALDLILNCGPESSEVLARCESREEAS